MNSSALVQLGCWLLALVFAIGAVDRGVAAPRVEGSCATHTCGCSPSAHDGGSCCCSVGGPRHVTAGPSVRCGGERDAALDGRTIALMTPALRASGSRPAIAALVAPPVAALTSMPLAPLAKVPISR